MPIDLIEYNRLKRRAEELRSQADKAQGGLEQHMRKLKTEFNCDSVEQAEKILEELKSEQNELETSYTKALAEFKKKWKDQL
jgi:hypothetical protein